MHGALHLHDAQQSASLSCCTPCNSRKRSLGSAVQPAQRVLTCPSAVCRLSPRGRDPGPQGGFVAARHFWASRSAGGPREETGGQGPSSLLTAAQLTSAAVMATELSTVVARLPPHGAFLQVPGMSIEALNERHLAPAALPGCGLGKCCDLAERFMAWTQARSAQGAAGAPQHRPLTAARRAQTRPRRSTGDPRVMRVRQRRCLRTQLQRPGPRLVLIVCLRRVRD